jgi:hypothetical protein
MFSSLHLYLRVHRPKKRSQTLKPATPTKLHQLARLFAEHGADLIMPIVPRHQIHQRSSKGSGVRDLIRLGSVPFAWLD